MHIGTWLGAVVVTASVVAAAQPAPGPAPAAPKAAPTPKGKKAPPKAKLDLSPLVTAFQGTDTTAAGKAAEALGAMTEPAAHDALLDGLAMGVSADVAAPAFAALVLHPAPTDVAALKRYAGHRNATVRGAALGALARYPDPAAHAAVVAGLHDRVGIVRAAAAAAAGQGHVREAVDPLFALLARGEDPAARALAAMADAELARRVGDQLGKVPDPMLSLALGTLLKRADFPEPAKVDIVHVLAKVADPSAEKALADYVDATPKKPVLQSRGEAEKIVAARRGGGK